MHHNVYVETEQHKNAEPAALLYPSLFNRQAQLASSTGEPSKQAGGYDSDPRQLGLACCALCSKKVQRLRLRLCDISGQTQKGKCASYTYFT